MRATVTRDNTTRSITLDVTGVPDIDVTTYHRKPRIFRPDQVTIKLTNGNVSDVNVSGGLVLKSGGTSDQVRENQHWWGKEWTGPGRSGFEVPAWLRSLVTEVLAGATSWHVPDVNNPEEVQTL